MSLLEQLQQLAPLAAQATEGPWRIELDQKDQDVPMLLSEYGHVANIEEGLGWAGDQEQAEATAAFIVAARNLLTPENLALLVKAVAPQWVPVAELPATLEEKCLYVLLPNNKVMQAMHTDLFTDDFEGQVWGHYTDIDCIDLLPVQPTHYCPPPAAPAL